GRDMSALFIACRDLFLDDRYTAVCRLHTKKSPHLHSGRAELFKRHSVENLLNSEGYTTNVLDLFRDKPWVGVAVPPIMHISLGTLGHGWLGNRPRVEALAAMLGLKTPIEATPPTAVYGGMFWFRPRALRKLFAHPWTWTDFEDEPYPLDGALGHALERMVCYVAQDAGFTTQQIISTHSAGWNYGMLEYKLQKLEAALPNADFGYRVRIVENWRNASYSQSSSVRQSLAALVLAVKRSAGHRLPRLVHALRPVYRTATLRHLRSRGDR
ncbi:rhamnan synthesis F family protein, partial [Teichococcus oryzae]